MRHQEPGIAGRKLVVDFYDSKINPNETRNDTIQACANDFAMVGTSAVFLTTVDDMRNCKDKAGATTGIPDIPFVTTAIVQQCSDQSFPMAAHAQVICSTKDQHPQTYQASVGRAFYYQKKFGKDLHGVYVFGNDSKSARDSSFSSGLGQMRAVGIKSDEDFDRVGRAPRRASSRRSCSRSRATTRTTRSAPASTPARSTSARRRRCRAVSSVKVWDCGVQCYDKKFIAAGGADVEGAVRRHSVPARSSTRPEQKANPMLGNFVRTRAPTRSTASVPTPGRRPSPSATPSTRSSKPTA